MAASNKINRRNFIVTGAKFGALGLLSTLPEFVQAKSKTKQITILHTNDWHSRIEPFPSDAGKNAGLGGAATRAALIQKIREEQPNVILLDAGDIFQGTPYFNFFEGELEYKLMSAMGYDAATLGNHDFDNGIEGIVNQLQHANFDLINCNYNFSGTLLEAKVKPYKIIQKNGIKIGITGVGIDLKGLVSDELFGNIIYTDPVQKASDMARELKQQKGCDFVICLSHLGFEYPSDKISDKILAQKSSNIDLIIGGHTHTFLPKPIIVKNTLNQDVIVNQAGWAGLQLGRIDLFFDKAKNLVNTGLSGNMTIGEKSV
ncbi:MAG: bifunctional metallophosphatase/5'-nucleotidase [Bacteroidota bacterium]|jgi:5'-nucleotidase